MHRFKFNLDFFVCLKMFVLNVNFSIVLGRFSIWCDSITQRLCHEIVNVIKLSRDEYYYHSLARSQRRRQLFRNLTNSHTIRWISEQHILPHKFEAITKSLWIWMNGNLRYFIQQLCCCFYFFISLAQIEAQKMQNIPTENMTEIQNLHFVSDCVRRSFVSNIITCRVSNT